MNKRIIILGVVVVAILAAAFFFLMPKTSPLNNNGTKTGNNNTPEQNADLFTQAFTGNESVKCAFTQEGSSATAYIKQGKIRIDSMGTDGAQYGNAIINGNMVYVWQTGNNTGYKIDTSTYEGANGMSGQEFTDPEKIKQEVQQSQPSCNKENIDDSVFTPPASVTFSDYSQMMQQFQNSNGTIPQGVDQSQYKDLIEEYAQ